MSYYSLHTHSQYSYKDALSTPYDIAMKAKETGLDAFSQAYGLKYEELVNDLPFLNPNDLQLDVWYTPDKTIYESYPYVKVLKGNLLQYKECKEEKGIKTYIFFNRNNEHKVELTSEEVNCLRINNFVSIYSSQGKEWEEVYIFMSSAFQKRQIMYTAFSRAKEHVHLFLPYIYHGSLTAQSFDGSTKGQRVGDAIGAAVGKAKR